LRKTNAEVDQLVVEHTCFYSKWTALANGENSSKLYMIPILILPSKAKSIQVN
jgi:hypothetical protein